VGDLVVGIGLVEGGGWIVGEKGLLGRFRVGDCSVYLGCSVL